MKTISEYLIGKNKSIDDPLKNIKFEFDIDDEAKDIFDSNDADDVNTFKEYFLQYSDDDFKKIKKVKFVLRVSKVSEKLDKYRFYLRINTDEFYEIWVFDKPKNKFIKPISNLRSFYGKEWYRRNDAKTEIIYSMLYLSKHYFNKSIF